MGKVWKLSFVACIVLLLFSIPVSAVEKPQAAEAAGVADATINSYTGDLALSFNLGSIPGRGGLGYSATLSYSSDVYAIINKDNYEAQSSWVGAGFTLDAPFVRLHNNGDVMDESKHEFYLSAPGLGNGKLVLISEEYLDDGITKKQNYRLQQDNNVRIERVYNTNYYVEDDWEITTTQGVKYIFSHSRDTIAFKSKPRTRTFGEIFIPPSSVYNFEEAIQLCAQHGGSITCAGNEGTLDALRSQMRQGQDVYLRNLDSNLNGVWDSQDNSCGTNFLTQFNLIPDMSPIEGYFSFTDPTTQETFYYNSQTGSYNSKPHVILTSNSIRSASSADPGTYVACVYGVPFQVSEPLTEQDDILELSSLPVKTDKVKDVKLDKTVIVTGNVVDENIGAYKRYVYRWDVSEIKDRFGNTLQFRYDDIEANADFLVNYKKSYIREIEDSYGYKLRFTRNSEREDVYYGEDRFTDDDLIPPNTVLDQKLSKVTAYSPTGTVLSSFDLEYDYIQDSLPEPNYNSYYYYYKCDGDYVDPYRDFISYTYSEHQNLVSTYNYIEECFYSAANPGQCSHPCIYLGNTNDCQEAVQDYLSCSKGIVVFPMGSHYGSYQGTNYIYYPTTPSTQQGDFRLAGGETIIDSNGDVIWSVHDQQNALRRQKKLVLSGIYRNAGYDYELRDVLRAKIYEFTYYDENTDYSSFGVGDNFDMLRLPVQANLPKNNEIGFLKSISYDTGAKTEFSYEPKGGFSGYHYYVRDIGGSEHQNVKRAFAGDAQNLGPVQLCEQSDDVDGGGIYDINDGFLISISQYAVDNCLRLPGCTWNYQAPEHQRCTYNGEQHTGYAVKSKAFYDGISLQPLITFNTFSTPVLHLENQENSYIGFNSVTSILPDGFGTSTTYYCNDQDEGCGQVGSVDQLDGFAYLSTTKDVNGKVYFSTQQTIEAVNTETPLSMAYIPPYRYEIKETSTMVDGVTNTVTMNYLDNGLLHYTSATNSDGTVLQQWMTYCAVGDCACDDRISPTFCDLDDRPTYTQLHELNLIGLERQKVARVNGQFERLTQLEYKDWGVGAIAPVRTIEGIGVDQHISSEVLEMQNGVVLAQRNARGYISRSRYDDKGLIIEETNALQQQMFYNYDYKNRLSLVIGPNEQTASYGYDTFDRLTSVRIPGIGYPTLFHEYSLVGDSISRDNLNKVTTKVLRGGSSEIPPSGIYTYENKYPGTNLCHEEMGGPLLNGLQCSEASARNYCLARGFDGYVENSKECSCTSGSCERAVTSIGSYWCQDNYYPTPDNPQWITGLQCYNEQANEVVDGYRITEMRYDGNGNNIDSIIVKDNGVQLYQEKKYTPLGKIKAVEEAVEIPLTQERSFVDQDSSVIIYTQDPANRVHKIFPVGTYVEGDEDQFCTQENPCTEYYYNNDIEIMKNGVLNPGFELSTNPVYWSAHNAQSLISVVVNPVSQGSRALKVEYDSNNYAWISADSDIIPVYPGFNYTLKGMVRVDDITGVGMGIGAYYRLKCYQNGNPNPVLDKVSGPTTGGNTWQAHYITPFIMDQRADYCQVMASVGSGSSSQAQTSNGAIAYFDDVLFSVHAISCDEGYLCTMTIDSNRNYALTQTDNMGNTVKVSSQLGIVRFEYDGLGQLKKSWDANGRLVTDNEYNSLGFLVRSWTLNGGETSYTYDLNGNLKTITKPNGDVYSYEYDPLDRVVEEKINGQVTLEYIYDYLTETQAASSSNLITGLAVIPTNTNPPYLGWSECYDMRQPGQQTCQEICDGLNMQLEDGARASPYCTDSTGAYGEYYGQLWNTITTCQDGLFNYNSRNSDGLIFEPNSLPYGVSENPYGRCCCYAPDFERCTDGTISGTGLNYYGDYPEQNYYCSNQNYDTPGYLNPTQDGQMCFPFSQSDGYTNTLNPQLIPDGDACGCQYGYDTVLGDSFGYLNPCISYEEINARDYCLNYDYKEVLQINTCSKWYGIGVESEVGSFDWNMGHGKPWRCQDTGSGHYDFVENCVVCGCPTADSDGNSLSCDVSSGKCYASTCEDNTPIGQCSDSTYGFECSLEGGVTDLRINVERCGCIDGTPFNTCSQDSEYQGYKCKYGGYGLDNGLHKDCIACADFMPENGNTYTCDSQTGIFTLDTCSDETQSETCSDNSGWLCSMETESLIYPPGDNGNYDCMRCGCASGQICNVDEYLTNLQPSPTFPDMTPGSNICEVLGYTFPCDYNAVVDVGSCYVDGCNIGSIEVEVGQCQDGLYCQPNGQSVTDCNECGCENGETCQLNGQCAPAEACDTAGLVFPGHCEQGGEQQFCNMNSQFEQNCLVCGCPNDGTCNSDGSCTPFTDDECGYGVGKLCKLVNPIEQNEIRYKYDQRGNIISIIEEVENVMYETKYEYDYSDHITKIILPNDKTIAYSYNNLDQIEKAIINGQEEFTFVYTAFGSLANIYYPNGLVLTNIYNEQNQVQATVVGNLLMELYQYDGEGNLIGMENLAVPSSGVDFIYDQANRLIEFKNRNVPYYTPAEVEGALIDVSYTYDKTGNRLNREVRGSSTKIGTTSYQYGDDNKLDTSSGFGGNCIYTYNDLGQLEDQNCDSIISHYTYDKRGSLILVENSDGTGFSYKYDASGRRIYKNSWKTAIDGSQKGKITIYIYGFSDEPIVIKEKTWTETTIQEPVVRPNRLAKEVAMPTGMATATVVYGEEETSTNYFIGSRLLATEKPNSPLLLYHQDRLGTNRVVTDEFKNVHGQFKNLPFGQVLVESNDIRFGFTGKEKEGNLYYFGARYYNPQLGLFLSTDPVEDNHPYSLTNANPMTFVDPDGRDPLSANYDTNDLNGLFRDNGRGGLFKDKDENGNIRMTFDNAYLRMRFYELKKEAEISTEPDAYNRGGEGESETSDITKTVKFEGKSLYIGQRISENLFVEMKYNYNSQTNQYEAEGLNVKTWLPNRDYATQFFTDLNKATEYMRQSAELSIEYTEGSYDKFGKYTPGPYTLVLGPRLAEERLKVYDTVQSLDDLTNQITSETTTKSDSAYFAGAVVGGGARFELGSFQFYPVVKVSMMNKFDPLMDYGLTVNLKNTELNINAVEVSSGNYQYYTTVKVGFDFLK